MEQMPPIVETTPAETINSTSTRTHPVSNERVRLRRRSYAIGTPHALETTLPPGYQNTSEYIIGLGNNSNLTQRWRQDMERQRNYYMHYYLSVRSSGEAQAMAVRNSPSQVPMIQNFGPQVALPFFIAPVPATGSNTNNQINASTQQGTSTINLNQQRLPSLDDSDFLRGVIHGTITTMRESRIGGPHDSILLNVGNHGLTKQEINRHTVSYEYKPKKRKRMKSAISNGIESGEEKSLNNSNECDSCSICLDRFCTNISVRRLPCLHVFHNKCIDKWLKQNKKCPICRISITIDYEKMICSLKSGNSIEQCLSQQEAPINNLSNIIQELPSSVSGYQSPIINVTDYGRLEDVLARQGINSSLLTFSNPQNVSSDAGNNDNN